MLRKLLSHPRTRGFSLDDPRLTLARRQVIHDNRFLSQIYRQWYSLICASIPAGPGAVLELGSGAGFLSELLPGLITSEIFYLDDLKMVLDGERLPFAASALKAIVMTDVLHHIPNVYRFFSEAARVVRRDGVISMIEPWNSDWSRFIYTYLHHELFDVHSPSWTLAYTGPLSSANGALPWIMFERDRLRFEREFPEWQIMRLQPFMPFAYLLSGGVSLRPLIPGWVFPPVRWLEDRLAPYMSRLGMFAHITLVRKAG